MDVPLHVCEARDPKGLYKRARAGEIKGKLNPTCFIFFSQPIHRHDPTHMLIIKCFFFSRNYFFYRFHRNRWPLRTTFGLRGSYIIIYYILFIIVFFIYSESLACYYYDVQIVIQNNRDENSSSSLSEMAEIVVTYLDQNGYLKPS